MLGPTWAEINLDAIAANVRHIKTHIGPSVELIAVVKANAYGHGAVPVAQAALEAGATRLAVARVAEGIELRQAGIEAPILVMGYTPPPEVSQAARWNLTLTLITVEQAKILSQEATRLGRMLPVHIKVDTGMGRFGLLPDEVVDFVKAVSTLPGLELEGLYTHFSVADEVSEGSTAYTRRQFRIYTQVARELEQAGFRFPLKHVCNSAATMRFPEMHLDAVRVGIALYGLVPSEETPIPFPLQPALSLKSTVARVRTLPPGSSISYGRTYTTTRHTPVALVPVGYGEGYHRLISNRGCVLIRGKRAPIVGRVCMDQFVVDVTGIEGVRQDDEVVLIGSQGNERITAEEVARWAETINYEVVTSLLPRVTRVYLKEGKVVEVKGMVG
ncbi:MAG: alanine racemase [Chloroflexi bacterium]|nr:MAG: alanine racemase [Chloroflexota bacterium]